MFFRDFAKWIVQCFSLENSHKFLFKQFKWWPSNHLTPFLDTFAKLNRNSFVFVERGHAWFVKISLVKSKIRKYLYETESLRSSTRNSSFPILSRSLFPNSLPKGGSSRFILGIVIFNNNTLVSFIIYFIYFIFIFSM